MKINLVFLFITLLFIGTLSGWFDEAPIGNPFPLLATNLLLGYLSLSWLYKLFWGAYWSDLSILIAAKLGYVPAQMFFGDRYYYGVLGEVEVEKRSHVVKEEPLGEERNVGDIVNYDTETRVLVKKDYKKAFYWYKQAATKGNTEAQDNIASMYENGEGVVKNYDQALHWYKKALPGNKKLAEQGDTSAQYRLAGYYVKFRMEENYIDAYKWLVLAKSKTTNEGELEAIDEGLKFLEEKMTGSQISEAQNLASQF